MFGGFTISSGTLLKNVGQAAINQRGAQSQIDKIGTRGYEYSLAMVGNAGQLTIITAIGEAGYQEAAELDYDESSEAGETLYYMASHPEAVIEIIAEVGANMTEEIQELKLREGQEAQQ
jgi:hypothetical protein